MLTRPKTNQSSLYIKCLIDQYIYIYNIDHVYDIWFCYLNILRLNNRAQDMFLFDVFNALHMWLRRTESFVSVEDREFESRSRFTKGDTLYK